jgi:hypothetical protein
VRCGALPQVFVLVLAGFSLLASARENEVVERFFDITRNLHEHRAEMITRFSGEKPAGIAERSKGMRIYLRWAPSNSEQLRNLAVSFESEEKESRESVPIREEHDWGLLWYSALLAKPTGAIGVLRVKADVESRVFRTPFQSIRQVAVFEGSVPVVLSSVDGTLRVLVELDSDSPFSERKKAERALKLRVLTGAAR